MKVSIVACGHSAQNWFETPYDISIGVNDCVKWGCDVDTLVLINAPEQFQPRKLNKYTDRLKAIKRSYPGQVLTTMREDWKPHFPKINVEGVTTQLFHAKYFKKGMLTHSKTSPFVALNFAFNIGATEIILWGIDLIDHPVMRPEQRETAFEIEQYLKMIQIIERHGVKVFIGSENTAFKNKIPVYK
jgi:hypothetical protein